MQVVDLIEEMERQMQVCNACRYCEGYCAVWHAIEWRTEFKEADAAYLSHLCHDCRDCYHACPYTEPHEYAINPPKIFSAVRHELYRQHAWPRAVAHVLYGKWNSLLAGILGFLVFVAIGLQHAGTIFGTFIGSGAYYWVIPEALMVEVFLFLGLYVLVAWVVTGVRFWRSLPHKWIDGVRLEDVTIALKYAFTLRYLGGTRDEGCDDAAEALTPYRRWSHHLVFFGFLLDLASTTWAAFNSHVLGIQAPYPVGSPVVILGSLGGIGIVVGGIGLLYTRRRSTPAAMDQEADAVSTSFTLTLVMVALTGMALLAVRSSAVMGLLLAVHLGSVAALYVTAPYSKFAHFVFRFLALVQYAREERIAVGASTSPLLSQNQPVPDAEQH